MLNSTDENKNLCIHLIILHLSLHVQLEYTSNINDINFFQFHNFIIYSCEIIYIDISADYFYFSLLLFCFSITWVIFYILNIVLKVTTDCWHNLPRTISYNRSRWKNRISLSPPDS